MYKILALVAFLFFDLLSANDELTLCKNYEGKSENVIGQTRPMNLMIKTLQGYSFPEKINKTNTMFSKMPSIEVLAKNRVDLVVLWNSKGDFLNISNKLKQVGIKTCALDLNTLENYIESYKILGKILNKEHRGNELSAFIEKKVLFINSISKEIPLEKKVTVYHAKGEDGLLTNCRNSPHSELIEFVGAINPIECNSLKQQRIKLNFEELMLKNPDVIITDNKGFYNKVYKSKKYSFLKAVKNKKVFMIPKKPINWMDNPPSFFKTIGSLWLANKLYPDYYKLDMKKEKEEFFELFLSRNK